MLSLYLKCVLYSEWNRGALLPLFFMFSVEYVTRDVQENQKALKLSRTLYLLVYADNVGQRLKYHREKNVISITNL
jgi:hypothetical protein